MSNETLEYRHPLLKVEERDRLRATYYEWAERHEDGEYRSVARWLLIALDTIAAASSRIGILEKVVEDSYRALLDGHTTSAIKELWLAGERQNTASEGQPK